MTAAAQDWLVVRRRQEESDGGSNIANLDWIGGGGKIGLAWRGGSNMMARWQQ